MLAPRRRVFAWMGPLLAVSWLSVARLDLGAPSHAGLGYFLGSLFAHATLAAAWLAFGPGELIWRFPLSIAWATSLPLAGGINLAVNGGHDDAIFVVGCCLLGQWLALQLPFWALALGLGLHLQHSDNAKETNGGPLRFGIRHLLIVMLIAGVVLGVGRIVVANVKLTGGGEAPAFISWRRPRSC